MFFPCTWKSLEATRVWFCDNDSFLIKGAEDVIGELSLGSTFGPADVVRQQRNWIDVSFQFKFQSRCFRHKHLLPAEVFWLSRIDALDQSPDLLSDNLLTVETLIDSRRNTEIWIRNDYCVNVFTKYMDCKFWVEGRNGRLLVRARYYDAINTGDYETVNYFFPISELVFRPDHVYVMKNGQIEDVDLFAAGRIKAELLS